jgi:hypothetical protein
MNKNIKVKKLVSLYPTKYKEISLKEASAGYFNYLERFQDAISPFTRQKTFIQWLESEI